MTDAITTETARMVMWRNAVKKEQDAARVHVENWGFLHNKPDETLKKQVKSFATRPTKYYSGGATVVMKRLPMLPQDQAAAEASQAIDVEELISTKTYRAVPPKKGNQVTGPLSALESTLHSHANRLDTIRTTDPFHHTTSGAYGSRLPIEQFGLTGYERIDSSITNWSKQEYLY